MTDGTNDRKERQTYTYSCRCSMLEEVYDTHKTRFEEHNKINTSMTDGSTSHEYGKDKKVFRRQWVVHWPRTYLAVNSIFFRKLYTSIVGININISICQGWSKVRTIRSVSFCVVSRDQLESSLRASLFRFTKPYIVSKQLGFSHGIREE